MREIKFRAWDKKNKRMLLLELNGFLTDIEDARYTLLEVVFSSRHVAYVDDYYHNTNQEQFSLMQNTGLKDKNGKEIYEGDIVALDMWQGNEQGYIPEDGIVKWYQPSSAFKWFSLEEDSSDGNNYWLSQADEHQREVIGNIYENKELLK